MYLHSGMAQNRTYTSIFQLSNTNATTLLNCVITSLAGTTGITLTQPYIIIRHLRLVNTSASAATASLFIGAAATASAGTEYCVSATSIPGNSYLDFYPMTRLSSAQYLCGGSGTNNVITCVVESEVGLS